MPCPPSFLFALPYTLSGYRQAGNIPIKAHSLLHAFCPSRYFSATSACRTPSDTVCLCQSYCARRPTDQVAPRRGPGRPCTNPVSAPATGDTMARLTSPRVIDIRSPLSRPAPVLLLPRLRHQPMPRPLQRLFLSSVLCTAYRRNPRPRDPSCEYDWSSSWSWSSAHDSGFMNFPISRITDFRRHRMRHAGQRRRGSGASSPPLFPFPAGTAETSTRASSTTRQTWRMPPVWKEARSTATYTCKAS